VPTSRSNHPEGSGCEVTVKITGLLSFMLGATDTTKYPDVAPAGMLVVTDVSLHEMIVIGAAFNITALLPCVAPKPEPVIITWFPGAPVVADTAVIAGLGAAVEVTDT
jgi:hypothetical protein